MRKLTLWFWCEAAFCALVFVMHAWSWDNVNSCLLPTVVGLSDSQLNRGENSWLHQVEQLLESERVVRVWGVRVWGMRVWWCEGVRVLGVRVEDLRFVCKAWCVCTYTVHVCVCVCVLCMWYIYLWLYAHTHTHACLRAHTYTHTHTQLSVDYWLGMVYTDWGSRAY